MPTLTVEPGEGATHYTLTNGDGVPPRRLIRVTSVLGLLRDDLKLIPADVLEHAAARGTAVHRGCWILCGGPDGSGLAWNTVDAEIEPYLRAFVAAQRELRFSVVWKEKVVASTRFGFAGRLDLVVDRLSRRRAVLDIKTGTEHPTHELQLAGYVQALKDTEGGRVYDRHILYLRPSGTYRLVSLRAEDQDRDFKVFSCALQVYR